jgi:hypothetical protein
VGISQEIQCTSLIAREFAAMRNETDGHAFRTGFCGKRTVVCRGFFEMSGSQQDTDVVSVEQEVAIYLSGFVATHC